MLHYFRDIIYSSEYLKKFCHIIYVRNRKKSIYFKSECLVLTKHHFDFIKNLSYFSIFLLRTSSIGPKRRLNSSRPNDRSLHLVIALTLACRTVFFIKEISPKYSFSLYFRITSPLDYFNEVLF